MIIKATIYGLLGMIILLIIYFSVISLISGWSFTISQFNQFWYFVISLAVGFGVQIGLYTYLQATLRAKANGVLAVSGTTSTAAMLSCCAHYLANILPLVGVAGALSLISQYQIALFWVGLLFNISGIIYIGRKVLFRQR